MQSRLCNLGYAIYARLCNPGCAIQAMQSWLRNLGYAILAMQSGLCTHWLRNLGYAILAMQSGLCNQRAHMSTGASREAPVDNECFSKMLTTRNLGIGGLGILA